MQASVTDRALRWSRCSPSVDRPPEGAWARPPDWMPGGRTWTRLSRNPTHQASRLFMEMDGL